VSNTRNGRQAAGVSGSWWSGGLPFAGQRKKERSQPSEDGIALFELMLERRKAILACRLGLEGIRAAVGQTRAPSRTGLAGVFAHLRHRGQLIMCD
jgi:hypothetical protein